MKPLFTGVSVAAASHALVTLDDLREQLRVNPNDTANNTWWTKTIERASRQAEGYCNRVFVQQTYVDTFAGGSSAASDAEPLILSNAPVDPASVVVSIDGAPLDVSLYGVDQESGLLYRTDQQSWSSATSLVVSYVAGFDPIPDDIQLAVIDLCTMDNSGRGRDPLLRASESPGLGRQEYWVGGPPGGGSIPQDIAFVLDGYLRGFIG